MQNSEARKRKEEKVQISVSEALEMVTKNLEDTIALLKAILASDQGPKS